MKTIKFFSAICIVIIAVFLSSCIENAAENNPVISAAEYETPEAFTSIDEPRIMNKTMSGESINNVTTIDTSLYPLHIRDNYQDHMYLKPIPNIGSLLPGFYAYEGKYVHNNFEFNAAVIYYKQTKTFSASLGYFNDQIFNYHCQWQATNYFRGTYCTMNPSSFYTNKQRDIRCVFTKGSFPDMNL